MAYVLSELAPARTKPFRVIQPRATDEGELLRLYTPVINRWRDSASRMMVAYTLAMNTGELAGLDEEDRETAAEIAALLALIQWGSFFGRVETWHRGKWIADVRRATGVDVTYLARPSMGAATGPIVNRAARRAAASQGVVASARAAMPAGSIVSGIDRAVSESVAANVGLVRSVSDDTRARIYNAVMGGVRSGKKAEDVAREINRGLAGSRARAGRIAINQMDAAVTAMTRARAEEAGISKFIWRHYTPIERARMNHLLRQGQVYRWDDKTLDALPGVLVGCRCRAEPAMV